MGKINLLTPQVANLIAAGEVVERPASVVKELVENAIDAEASRIVVEIQRGGVRYIRVTDNGCGMAREDVPVSLKRHATSKICTQKDLDAILTLGFRGEALAAISSVSRLRIMTRRSCDTLGTLLTAAGGQDVTVTDCGCPVGTSVIVEDLFYNAPARLKFLKKDVKEAIAVTSLLEKVALSRPDIAFQLINDGTTKFETAGDNNLKNAVYAVLGRDFSAKTVSVRGGFDGVEIEGMIGTPENVRANRNFQIFYVNARYIRSRIISSALEQAFTSYAPTEKFPAAVLFLRIHPSLVDVNVHPSKMEVKFSNEKLIFEAVYYAVRSALEKLQVRPQFYTDETLRKHQIARDIVHAQTSLPQGANSGEERQTVQQRQRTLQQGALSADAADLTLPELREEVQPAAEEPRFAPVAPWDDPLRDVSSAKNNVSVSEKKTIPSQSLSDQTDDTEEKNGFWSSSISDTVVGKPTKPDVSKRPAKSLGALGNGFAPFNMEHVPSTPRMPVHDDLVTPFARNEQKTPVKTGQKDPTADVPPYRLVGEVFQCYVLVECGDVCLIIDKHAAHERILFEELKKNMQQAKPYGQILLAPLTVSLSAEECAAVTEEREALEKLGYSFILQEQHVQMEQIPAQLQTQTAVDLFVSIAGQLVNGEGEVDISASMRFEKALYQGACKAAIKGGKEYDEGHIRWIVERVLTMPDIKYCPHGRPVCFEMSKQSIDHRFLRC